MSSITKKFREKLSKAIFTGTTFPKLTAAALFNTSVSSEGEGTEVSGTGYSRLTLTNTNLKFSGSTPFVLNNQTALTFSSDLPASWGQLNALAFADSSDILAYCPISTPVTPGLGAKVVVPIDGAYVNFTNDESEVLFTSPFISQLGSLITGDATTLPDEFSMALLTAADVSGTFTEVTGSDYARQSTAWAWDATEEKILNSDYIDFGVAGSEWGDIPFWGLFNTNLFGTPTLCMFGKFDHAVHINDADVVRIYPNTLCPLTLLV